MLSAKESNCDVLPVGDLKIIALPGCQKLGQKVDNWIVKWRSWREDERKSSSVPNYAEDTYLVRAATPRFGTGEAKGQIFGSVRGDDVYILVDVCNYSLTYRINSYENHMSPDDYYQDLKRIVAAIGGKARRITVLMPYLYESRQDKRMTRESLDCAAALQELTAMGVDAIITFDAHEPRVQNAIPLHGFDDYHCVYQFIKGIYKSAPDFEVSPDKLMVISPDEAGTRRAIYMANMLGVDMGMFYKRRDYTKTVRGEHPIVAHEFLGADLNGRDVIILDDMISSGDRILEVAREMKSRNAGRIFMCATFGLFTEGLEKFDTAYEEGLFNRLLTTNLIYHTPELLSKPYYTGCDMSKFIALIIDTMNHDGSVSSLLDPVDRINRLLSRHEKQPSAE